MIQSFFVLEWLAFAEHELLLFAGVFFLVGSLDELAVDGIWAWLRLSGRRSTLAIRRGELEGQPLRGKAAVLIPAWQEAEVIGQTIAHTLRVWPQEQLRLYVGCYANDAATVEAAVDAADGDARLRVVLHDRAGPTTKADCLNRLYEALYEEERRSGQSYRMVLLHDAEDMVDPAALPVLDAAMEDADFVQIPVLPVYQPGSRWVSAHYCEEFAEAHAKALVVRDALGAALPAAGVGCAFGRSILQRLADESRRYRPTSRGPFAPECLTEDYELGLRIKALKGRARFLRLRGEDGALVATRACFPGRLSFAVRQKTRWIHGIALQGWERLGWSAHPVELWMRMRDRRGPLTAIVLSAAYLLLAIAGVLLAARMAGYARPWQAGPLLQFLILANLTGFVWRASLRCLFTAREYGWAEGFRAVLRIPLANIIAIMAGRRALFAYLRTLGGAPPAWDKTAHMAHPAAFVGGRPS